LNGHYALRAARLLTGAEELVDAVVEVADGRVVYAGPYRPGVDEGAIDPGDAVVLPGFIDLHVHGNGGAWWGQSEESDRAIAMRMAAGGTTSCLASLGGRRTFDEMLETIAVAAKAAGRTDDGVEVLGIHMEGPFISSEKRGAWMPEQLRRPNIDELRAMQEAAAGTIRTMTIAPELPGALEVGAEAIELGIRPAIGHTNATYEQARAGINAGLSIATHTFNAMRGLHHRDPGAVGAVLASPFVDAELIADGQHVARGAIEVLLAAKGVERVLLVTDNVALTGVEPGEYGSGPRVVTVTKDGVTLADGTIAGSVLPFNQHVANMAEIAGLANAVVMASVNPARVIGVGENKGSIEAGKDADLVLLDRDFKVRMTIIHGRVVYSDPLGEKAPAATGIQQ
jgi:N-acetylglucosamine-6-phosphate deacetylase